ncbi:MAG: recombinase family protein [Planctomycetales bacterium]|nr:recombinase family protein [Planctomycetales bacterium]
MSRSKYRLRGVPRRRRRPPLTAAVITVPGRRFSPSAAIFWTLVVGILTILAGEEAHAGGVTVSGEVVPYMADLPCAADPPSPTIPDGRPLGSARGAKPRRGSRRKEQLERERAERRRKTEVEIDRLHAEYWQEAGGKKSWPTGTAYARFSTRFQESIADQIRKILEFALANQIRIPRNLIFCDLGVRGVKNRRDGLDDVRATLRTRKARVLLLFATNRLFRKTYRTLEFVDTVHKELQARCIFVMTGIDTDNRDQWESLLHLHALMDQFVVRAGVAHIHAAHEGLLEKRIVFGTLSYGYGGRPIEGAFTKRKLPRREIIIDETTAAVVRQIFRWYVDERLDVIEIIRRLNADPSIPKPPKSQNEEWTRLAVRNILKNTRYRGLWKYGVCESVFLPEADYVRQRQRVEPLKEVQIDDLRIVDDALWYAAQERLATERSGRRGRPPADGNAARPKLLNGLLVCPDHDDQVLHVGGPRGNAMVCPRCRAVPAAERPLFTVLNRALATELIVGRVIELLAGDAALVEQSIAVCRAAAESAQRPDPQAAARARQELTRLERAIGLTRRTAGESPEDQEQAAGEIRELQGAAAGVRAELARLESLNERVVRVPTDGEITAILAEAARNLTAAATSDDPEVVAQARRILELVTDGRITLEQQGERKSHRGWLRGRFRVRLLSFLVAQCGGVAADEGYEVTIDFRRPSQRDAEAERAWQLREQDKLLSVEIAERLGCGKRQVTQLLKHAAAMRGVPYEDGRSRRSGLQRKHRTPPLFERMAAEVGRLVEQGLLLVEIGERLPLDRTTLTKAYNKYRADQGLPPLDGRARRKLLDHKNRPASDRDSP